jgi:hypothetical protein
VRPALGRAGPTDSIQTGMAPSDQVTLIGVEVCNAKYCSALKLPRLTRQGWNGAASADHKSFSARSARHPSGSRIRPANSQRKKLRVRSDSADQKLLSLLTMPPLLWAGNAVIGRLMYVAAQ